MRAPCLLQNQESSDPCRGGDHAKVTSTYMKKRTLYILFGILGMVAAIALTIEIINRPAKNAAGQRAVAEVSADSVYAQYFTHESEANRRYLNNIIIVKGRVADFGNNGHHLFILLATGGVGTINCEMVMNGPSGLLKISKNQLIAIKGRCTGFLMDVNLVDGIIVK